VTRIHQFESQICRPFTKIRSIPDYDSPIQISGSRIHDYDSGISDYDSLTHDYDSPIRD